ncbi:hypothetical protein EW146_g7380 [Bondarzewia mesenterica]|uniref:Uncharacterized protein n=1 Tax=Bondarzewia mesenterica TaxID=1095465 RepID=A0A4S4LMT8_9AGAM|nr:hypothetical protein EW146_g7380 [Bondarzewia mesenterica]
MCVRSYPSARARANDLSHTHSAQVWKSKRRGGEWSSIDPDPESGVGGPGHFTRSLAPFVHSTLSIFEMPSIPRSNATSRPGHPRPAPPPPSRREIHDGTVTRATQHAAYTCVKAAKNSKANGSRGRTKFEIRRR